MSGYLLIAGTSDIGEKLAYKLKNENKQIFITSREPEKHLDFLKEIGCEYKKLDATNFDEVEETVKFAQDKLGGLQGIVNLSGSMILKSAHMTSYDEYLDTIHTNLTTAFATVRSAGKFMNNGGSVVLLSTAAAEIGLSNHEAISAAKAGIIGLARSAAATYASHNLRFNVVAPGLVETKLTTELTGNDLFNQISKNMHALKRFGKPEEIAEAIWFLLNPINSWITGQVINVDGGLSTIQPKAKI